MPPAVAALAAAGGSAASSTIGASKAAQAKKEQQQAAEALANEAAQQYDTARVPTIEEQLIQLERIKNAGNLTPEMVATIEQKESELNAYKQNPEAYTAQVQALKSLQDLGKNGGLTAMDKAQLNEIQNKVSNQNASSRGAILQNFAQRGMSGSGAELAASLAGNQAALGSAADQGFNVAAQAQQRALQAIQGAGDLGGKIESQQFGEAAQKASAQNAINQFNASNAQNVSGQNTQRANYAQERNLNNEQQINQANTALANQEQINNKALYQQQFQDQLAKASGKANALGNQANIAEKGVNSAGQFASAAGQAGAQLGTAVGGYFADQSGKKKKADETEIG